ncbi:hypothetical protein HY333_01800 [Candidatus Collierbacteria bacterium]|nr:hypothetical protein [Candidatus Collierbacteria bacterium]
MDNFTNKQQALDHLRNDITYPATGKEIVAECDNMKEEVTEEERKWLEQKLGDRTYQSADEAINTLGW